MSNVFKALLSILIFLNTGITPLYAQITQPIQVEKPEKYKNKQLGSEKTGEKKLKLPRRFIQNTVTHYNWYYNANTKLQLILERAKMAHQDDFSTLLSFYPYTLEATLSDSLELDSVITKSSTGILVHDLRNDWIDNLFLLIGKAYYYKNEFDSAYNSFQFINYSYSPRDKNDYRIPVGSNVAEGGSAMKISTVESKSLPKKVLSLPPSRNDALIWQVKAHIAKKDFGSASGLIEILRNDPDFPERLHSTLSEMQALYYYQLGIPDSAALYLSAALPNAESKNEMARWEYLTAQLYELSNDRENARKYYALAIKRTTNPVLEVYARLAALKQHPGDEFAVEEQLAALIKMGKRDKYIAYRDIIFFAAAQIELDRGNIAAAKELLKKAVDTKPKPGFIQSKRNNALLALGDIAFSEGAFREAADYYQTIPQNDPAIANPLEFTSRLGQLQNIITSYDVVTRQDSLQHLAGLPEDERERIILAEVKKYRKLSGMDEEESRTRLDRNQETEDLFNQRSKGDWYFYNASLKSRGYNEFIAKWGSRENSDNWRRGGMQRAGNLPASQTSNVLATDNPYSYEALLSKIPLSIELMEISNDSIESAKISIGKIFFENLEDYEMVIKTLEGFQESYPYSGRLGEALYYLYFSYKKLGKNDLANQMRVDLNQKFEGSPYVNLVNMAATGQIPDDPALAMRQKYDEVYNLFIEGNFSDAIAEKAKADSVYGNHYWTPQLLYIESVYYIRQRNDGKARQVLSQIINRFPEHLMKEKAETMINVLNRRREIENYLTNLEISKPEDEEEIVIYQPKDVKSIPDAPKDAVAKDLNAVLTEQKETSKPDIQITKERGEIPLTKIVPPVIEPKDTMSREEPEILQPEKDSVVKEEPVKTDTALVKTEPVINKDTIATMPGRVISGSYIYDKSVPHHVVLVLNKVDPVYITESRNAFNLYHRQRPSTARITIENFEFSDSLNFVIMKGFSNAEEALRYSKNVKEEAQVVIIPWLPREKYHFMVISDENLQKLIELGETKEYAEFEAKFLPESIEQP